MIIRIEDLKNISQTILAAVDSNELSVLTETLELIVKDSVFCMNVTNREYYAQARFKMDGESNFHATVNANLFLKLVSKITTETVEFTVANNYLVVKGNGTYKLPLIYDGDSLLSLPTIDINNVTEEFDADSSIFNSIASYNSKQLSSGIISKPVQKMYYIDDKGAITFTSGACINSFNLPKPIKILLNNRIVKLFKLFKDGSVHVTIGHDKLNDETVQTKIKFDCKDVSITSILMYDDNMVSSVPVSTIRGMGSTQYAFSVNFNRENILSAIQRFLLFSNGVASTACCLFEFSKDSVIISDTNGENKEEIKYNNESNIKDVYKAYLDLNDLKSVLESYSDEYINVNLGDSKAIIICHGNIKNVIPEMRVS